MNDDKKVPNWQLSSNGIAFYVDIVDACNLHCKMCYRGNRFLKNTKNYMSIEVFREVIDKAVRIGCTFVGLYN